MKGEGFVVGLSIAEEFNYFAFGFIVSDGLGDFDEGSKVLFESGFVLHLGRESKTALPYLRKHPVQPYFPIPVYLARTVLPLGFSIGGGVVADGTTPGPIIT